MRLFTLVFTVRNVCNSLKIISLTPFVFSKSVDIQDVPKQFCQFKAYQMGCLEKYALSPCYEYFCCEHALKLLNPIIDKDRFTHEKF